MSNYPAGFNGLEGEEEIDYLFYLQGEIELTGYDEEEALEELKDMTIREAIEKGLLID